MKTRGRGVQRGKRVERWGKGHVSRLFTEGGEEKSGDGGVARRHSTYVDGRRRGIE